MLHYLYNLKDQDTWMKTQQRKCPFKPPDFSKAETLDFAVSREWEFLVNPGRAQALPGVCLEPQKSLEMTSHLCFCLGLVVFGPRSRLCPHVSSGWSSDDHTRDFSLRQKQGCWLVKKVGLWPTGKDAGCDSEVPGVGKENPLLWKLIGSLGKKNGDLWWGICNSGQK